MSAPKLGIRLESLGLSLRQGLQEAARLGARGVELDAVGDLAPGTLSQSGRRELRHLLRAHYLELTALGCPLRRGLDTPDNLQPRIEHVQKAMSLSSDLGACVAIVQAGRVPEKGDDPRAQFLLESLRALGQHGDRTGATLALETGLESGPVLRQFLARFDSGALGANLDPANLLLHGHDPYESARALGDKIVHVHARDARWASPSRAAQEVPLGHGDIDWMQLLGALEEVEYRGWLTVVRDTGENRLADIASGLAFLRRFTGS
jgi:sugar phosphate isomerase/epimerase